MPKVRLIQIKSIVVVC